MPCEAMAHSTKYTSINERTPYCCSSSSRPTVRNTLADVSCEHIMPRAASAASSLASSNLTSVIVVPDARLSGKSQRDGNLYLLATGSSYGFGFDISVSQSSTILSHLATTSEGKVA